METKYVNTRTYTESLVWWKSVEKGSYSEDVVHNHLRAGGRIVFDAGKGVYVEFADGKGTVDEAIRTLSRKPELAWMADLQVRNDVEWNAVKAKFDQWNYKAEGLTQGAAALIALAVTIATQGAGTALLAGAGITATGPMAAAINAGYSTLASRATVSLINNKGDLGKVFKELGSNAFLKSLATSMLTAGLTAGLPTDILPVAPQGETLSFQQMLQANIVRNAIGASIGTAIQGGDLGDSLSNALIQAAVQSVGAQGAIAIGAAVGSNDMNKAFQLLAHAALGCAIGTATSGTRDGGKGSVGGAVGGVVGEVAATAWLVDRLNAGDIEAVLARTDGITLARLLGGVSALLAGGDVATGAQTGTNAAEFNALAIPVAAVAACAAHPVCRTAAVQGGRWVLSRVMAWVAANAPDIMLTEDHSEEGKRRREEEARKATQDAGVLRNVSNRNGGGPIGEGPDWEGEDPDGTKRIWEYKSITGEGKRTIEGALDAARENWRKIGVDDGINVVLDTRGSNKWGSIETMLQELGRISAGSRTYFDRVVVIAKDGVRLWTR